MTSFIKQKLCINCRHRRVGEFGVSLCTRRGIEYEPVLGREIGIANTFCAEERKPIRWYSRDRCGPEGKYYKDYTHD